MDTLSLTYRQRRRLEQQPLSTPDARTCRRTLAVLEIASGQSAGSVAGRLRVSPRAVYRWLAAYAAGRDPNALADADRPGRPTLFAQPQRDLLRELLAESPQGLGYPDTTWSVPLLRSHLRRHAGLSASEDTIRRELRRLRYSWKRPRYRLDPDPESRGKKAAHPQAHQAFAAPERGAGRGRDGPAAVPAAAVVLVARRPAEGGRAVRP
jgi:transposase